MRASLTKNSLLAWFGSMGQSHHFVPALEELLLRLFGSCNLAGIWLTA